MIRLVFCTILAASLGAAQVSTTATISSDVKIEFVNIPAGEFDMGCSPGDSECEDCESPRHHVTISKPFQIGKYPVTQSQWAALMGNAHRSGFPNPNYPVETLPWFDMQPFIEKLNSLKDGFVYRLPTEAEWEYAARAGTTDRFLGEKLEEIAWFQFNSDTRWGSKEVHPVGLKKPNRWGVYDMLGNVWEWCNDWYEKDYYAHSPKVDPKGPDTGTAKTCRGGAWNYPPKHVRVSRRGRHGATGWEATLGFRLVRTPR